MKLAKFHDLGYFHEVGKISWLLAIFMKLAKFYDFWLFSWCWAISTKISYFSSISVQFKKVLDYLNEVCRISWILVILRSQQNFMNFGYFTKLAEFNEIWLFYEVGRFSWILVTLWSWQNFMNFGYFVKLVEFHEFWLFYEIGRISWICYFMR